MNDIQLHLAMNNLPHLRWLLFLALALALGNLTRTQLPFGAIYAHDVVILGFWLSMSVRIFGLIKKLSFKMLVSNKWICLFLIMITVSYVHGLILGFDVFQGLVYLFRVATYTITIIFLANALKQNSTYNQLQLVHFTPLLSIVLIAWFGLVQYRFLPDARAFATLGWDDHYFRMVSTLLDPNYAGAAFVIGVLLVLHLIQKKLIKPNIGFGLQVLLTLCLALTFSRSSFLMFGIAIVSSSFFYFKTTFLKNLVLSVILVVGVLAAPKPAGEGVNLARTSTIDSRYTRFENQVSKLTWSEWLFGHGLFVSDKQDLLNTSEPTHLVKPNHATQADAWLITLLQGWGVLGTFLLAALVAKQAKNILKLPRTVVTLVMSLAGFGLFNNLFQPHVFLITLMTVATITLDNEP